MTHNIRFEQELKNELRAIYRDGYKNKVGGFPVGRTEQAHIDYLVDLYYKRIIELMGKDVLY